MHGVHPWSLLQGPGLARAWTLWSAGHLGAQREAPHPETKGLREDGDRCWGDALSCRPALDQTAPGLWGEGSPSGPQDCGKRVPLRAPGTMGGRSPSEPLQLWGDPLKTPRTVGGPPQSPQDCEGRVPSEPPRTVGGSSQSPWDCGGRVPSEPPRTVGGVLSEPLGLWGVLSEPPGLWGYTHSRWYGTCGPETCIYVKNILSFNLRN